MSRERGKELRSDLVFSSREEIMGVLSPWSCDSGGKSVLFRLGWPFKPSFSFSLLTNSIGGDENIKTVTTLASESLGVLGRGGYA